MIYGLRELTFDEVFDGLPVYGWLSKPEARLLWDEARLAGGAILEVGAYYGRSTVLLGSLGFRVHAVDPFGGFDEDDMVGDGICMSLISTLRQHNLAGVVVVHRIRIEDWKPQPCSFAYLDGEHNYESTLAQIDKSLECGVRTVAVHDVNDDGEGLEIKSAALSRLGPWRERVERLAVWRLEKDEEE